MKHFTIKACLKGMALALTALGLGQALGLFLPLHAEKIAEETVAEPTILTGTVIRQETVVLAPALGFWETDLEGQRVRAGQVICTLRDPQGETRDRQAICSMAAEAGEQALPRRRENIHKTISQVQQDPEAVTNLMALVLGETEQDAAAASSDAPALPRITAPVGGIFVTGSDGLETLLTPDSPEYDLTPEPDPLAVGRIITSDTWYFYAAVPAPLSPGDTLEAELLSGIFKTVTLRVRRVEHRGGGDCRVLFSCDSATAEAAKIRNLSVKILP